MKFGVHTASRSDVNHYHFCRTSRWSSAVTVGKQRPPVARAGTSTQWFSQCSACTYLYSLYIYLYRRGGVLHIQPLSACFPAAQLQTTGQSGGSSPQDKRSSSALSPLEELYRSHCLRKAHYILRDIKTISSQTLTLEPKQTPQDYETNRFK